MFLTILLLLLGLAILIVGGESLVRGSASLAKKLKIPSIVIGLTVVAFGTSMPELVVNIVSVLRGATDIAIGNIIGSNIANILLILGISATISSLKVQKGTTWKEIPLALLAAVLVLVMGNDIALGSGNFNALTPTEGLTLLALFIIFLYYIYGLSKVEGGPAENVRQYSTALSLLFIFGGILGLVIGGKILVDQAIILATLAGMSEALIGLTIVAVGTSLPELVTSVIATIHRHDDIAVGNVVGSNIFNIFWILGLSATMAPLPMNGLLNFDILVNIIATILLFGFMFVHTKHRINRWQGILFLCLYLGYVLLIVQRG